MSLKSLKCPNCGGNLEVEDGLDTFFCKYCGYKILLEDQSVAAYNAKVRVKYMEHKEKLQEKRNDQERYKMEFEKKDNKWNFIVGIGGLGTIIVLCFAMIMSGNVGEKKQEHELQAIVDEIMIDIENQDFAAAYIKANFLYWDDSYSSDGVEKWNATRKEIIKQIENAEKKVTGISSREAEEDNAEGGGLFEWFN